MAGSLSGFFAEEEAPEKTYLSEIFEEEPVSLEVFIRDKKYMGSDWMLSDVQYAAVRNIERVYLPELYPLMAEEFEGDYWKADIPMKNLINLQWGKGSSDPDSLVYSSLTGEWKKLRDWVNGDLVASHDLKTGKVSAQPTSEGFIEARGQMFEITTKRGLRMTVWEGHRFLTQDSSVPAAKRNQSSKWERLWNLPAGSRIAVASEVPEPLVTVPMPQHELEYLAFMIANGSCSGGHHGIFTCGNHAPLVREHARTLVKQFSNSEMRETLEEWKGTLRWHCKPVERGTKTYSRSVLDFLVRYGLDGKTAHNKVLPPEVFRLPNSQIALFISRLIETDGWMSLSNTAEIGYSTVSLELAEGIQRLALRLGVAMTISTKKTRNQVEGFEGIAYTVRVRDAEMVERLASQLSMLDKEPSRLAVLDHVSKITRRNVRFGDLIWDTIKTIEPKGEGEYWSLTEPLNANYVANGGIVNRNSGKDHVCRVSSLRVAYLLLCLRSPQKYFGMPEQDSIHMLNIAANAPQANRAFFTPLKQAVKLSPWFRDKAVPKRDNIEYDKNLEAVSGHSDAEGQEGLNIILGVADEIDAFKAKDEMVGTGKRAREASTSAESILKMLKGSASTRFPDSYKRVAISYPRYKGSTIQRLTEEAYADIEEVGNSNSIYFASGPLATWDVNPRISGPESYASDYRKNPDEAAAMYECKPKLASDAYFRNPDIFTQSVDRSEQPITVSYHLEEQVSPVTGEKTRGWEPVFRFAPDFLPVAGARYAMHGDLALVGDRAGIAMSHVMKWEERNEKVVAEDGEVSTESTVVPIIRNDFTIYFEADIGETPPREIQIRWARQLAFELIKRGFYIVSYTFDNFQSSDSMQTLNRHGIETKRVSTDLDPSIWRSLKDIASEGRLRMPYEKLLLTELKGLSKMAGGKVDHLVGSSKDLADAFACSILGASIAGGEEDSGVEPISVGEEFFETGEALAPLAGMDGYDYGGGLLSLPYGMRGMGFDV